MIKKHQIRIKEATEQCGNKQKCNEKNFSSALIICSTAISFLQYSYQMQSKHNKHDK